MGYTSKRLTAQLSLINQQLNQGYDSEQMFLVVTYVQGVSLCITY